MLERVVEGDDYFVLAQQGTISSEVWVTFSAYKDRGPISVSYLSKHGIPALHVINKADKWFQGLDVATIKQHLDAFTQGSPRIVVFGVSMGGFGALLYAAALGAEIILVSSPQVVIDPVLTDGHDERWRPDWSALRGAGQLSEPDATIGVLSTPTYVLIDDKCDEDMWQVAHLANRANVNLVSIPYGGHGVMHALREAGLLEAMTQAIRAGDVEAVGALSRLYRKIAKRDYAYLCELGLGVGLRGHASVGARILSTAAELKSDRHVAFTYLSQVLELAGDIPGSLAAAKQASARAGGILLNSGLYERLAHLHGLMGNLDGAEQAYADGVIALPGSAPLRANFATFLQVTGRGNGRVAALLQQAAELEPSNTTFALRLERLSKGDFAAASLYLEGQGDLPTALKAASVACERVSGEADDWMPFERLAHLHASSGDLDGAEQTYMRGLEAMPTNDVLRGRLENFLLVTGRGADRT